MEETVATLQSVVKADRQNGASHQNNSLDEDENTDSM